MERPQIAIVDPNTLAAMGLTQIIQNIMPIASVRTFGSFGEFSAAGPDNFVHYFVAQTVVLQNRQFFTEHIRKTLVLTLSNDPNTQLTGFYSFCVNTSEEEVVRQILRVMQYGHSGGRNLPELPGILKNKLLSNREAEVLSLVVQGYINKEIADKLNIGLTTVITHRKNITDKLGMKSVSALTIYAVMHGYVDINQI